MASRAAIALCLITAAFAPAHAEPARCAFGAEPEVLYQEGGYLARWDSPDDHVLSLEALPVSAILPSYQDKVRKVLPVDPHSLLRRYRDKKPLPGDLRNLEAVLSGSAGAIRPIRCAEALLLETQMRRNPRFDSEPTEFLAVFLKRSGALRVYFLTGDSGGIRGEPFSRLLKRLRDDKASGWEVDGNLHNHSFFLNALEEDKPQGVLAPSANDMKVAQGQRADLGLRSALITNGFDTVVIPSDQFGLFEAAP